MGLGTKALLVLLAIATISTGVCAQKVKEEDVAELAAMRKRAVDGVVQLNDDLLKRFIMGKKRPYTAVIFYSAQQVTSSNPGLRLDELRKEYGYAAKAFLRGPDADKIYFFEAALEVSQQPFAMLGVNALPYIVRINPGQAISASSPTDLPKADKMTPDSIGTQDYPWPAEKFVEHLGTSKDIRAAAIERPSIYQNPWFYVTITGGMAVLGVLVWKLFTTNLVRHPAIWAVLALAVFWFSASGGMYNIIRGMPLFIRDRNGRLQFFLSGRQGQLGAEGFTMGSLYLATSCSIAFLTYVAPRLPNTPLRNSVSFLLTVVSAGSLYQTFALWTKKTGYQHVLYF